MIVTSGGIGANHDLVRANWPSALGTPPQRMLSGVPDHVDGRMIQICQDAGASLINPDRMWHYTEGIENWNPIWTRHGIRILPGPSSLWLDARGRRLPCPLFPGFDTLGTLEHLMKTGYDYSWFVLTQKIIEREFALSGSEQNPDLTGRSVRRRDREPPGARARRRRSRRSSATAPTSSSSTTSATLVRRMNALTGDELIDAGELEREIKARDREIANPYTKDLQITAIHGARRYIPDRLSRVAKPHRLLDPGAGPLIAVRLWILTRKTLGGSRDRPLGAGCCARRRAAARALRRRRGGRLRRRRRARLPLARGHVPGRVPVQRARRRESGGAGSVVLGPPSAASVGPARGHLPARCNARRIPGESGDQVARNPEHRHSPPPGGQCGSTGSPSIRRSAPALGRCQDFASGT